MLRSVIISPDRELGDRLEGALLSSRRTGVVRRLSSYPNAVELVRFLRASGPELVFLSVESRNLALDVAHRIEEQAPGTQVVAIHRTCDSATLLETMRAGIREFLAPPFESPVLDEALARIEACVEQRPPAIQSTEAVFSFLPAKPGSGTTTTAVNAAMAIASEPDSEVLLMDLDLNSGLIGFMLLLQSQYSILDAAENALEMDENLWPRIVSKSGHLDVLPVGRLNPGYRIETSQIRHLLDFARRNYKAICVDLSGMMEKYSLEVLHESKQIFLVCTAELPCLHLAREKLSYLRTHDLDSRVRILLNRAQKRPQIPVSEMEGLFGMPIHMTLPNDYAGVHKALTAGKPVRPQSELGQRYRSLAESLVAKPSAAPEKKRGLLDLLVSRHKEEEVQNLV